MKPKSDVTQLQNQLGQGALEGEAEGDFNFAFYGSFNGLGCVALHDFFCYRPHRKVGPSLSATAKPVHIRMAIYGCMGLMAGGWTSGLYLRSQIVTFLTRQ